LRAVRESIPGSLEVVIDTALRQMKSGELQTLQIEFTISQSHGLGSSRPIMLLSTSALLVCCTQQAIAMGEPIENYLAMALGAIACFYQIARDALPRTPVRTLGDGARPFVVECAISLQVAAHNMELLVSNQHFMIVKTSADSAYIVMTRPPDDGHQAAASTETTKDLARLHSAVGVQENEFEPIPLVIITDPGKDNDDELALIMARTMCDMDLFDLRAVIANLRPSDARAKLARGTLDCLGMSDVPVAAGTDGKSQTHTDTFSSTIVGTGYDYCVNAVEPDSELLLEQVFEDAEPGSLVLLLISSLTDTADFIREHETLFAEKTARVAIMGGISADRNGLTEFMQIDPTAQNFTFDLESARYVFERCQELGVSMTVLSRAAAYAASVPAFIYDELATLGHPVALRLRESQLIAIASLWGRARLPAGDKGRLGLPARCDRAWFSQTFCGGTSLEFDDDRSIWPYVSTLNMYDVLALLAAHPATLEAFYEVEVRTVKGVDHVIIGPSNEQPGVPDPHKLRSFVMNALRYALAESREDAQQFQIVNKTVVVPSQKEDRRASVGERGKRVRKTSVDTSPSCSGVARRQSLKSSDSIPIPKPQGHSISAVGLPSPLRPPVVSSPLSEGSTSPAVSQSPRNRRHRVRRSHDLSDA